MARFKVVITDFDYGDTEVERSILEPIGAEVVALQAKSEDDLLAEARDCDAIMNQYARVGAKTISVMQRCKVVARYGVGVDIVDVEAATARGIQVTNVRDYCTEEVADHAVALWLTLARKLPQYDRATHDGVWRWQSGQPIHRLRGRTLGIVSFGKIGQAIAERARAFGLTIVVYDPYKDAGSVSALGAEPVGKQELLSRSDVIMMQVPMTPETRHFLGPAEFAQMRPGVIVIKYRPRPDNRQPGPLRSARLGAGQRGWGWTIRRRSRRNAPRGTQRQPALLAAERDRHAPFRLLLGGVDPNGARDRVERVARVLRGERRSIREHRPLAARSLDSRR
jgi:lactate dehydrogenase-like 2-hydroxyacid dehydrogenase